MRTSIVLLAIGSLLLAERSRAASPTLLVELVDAEPVGVRIQIPAAYDKPCESVASVTVFEGALRPGKPVRLSDEVPRFCVSQTWAPFVSTGWSAPRIVTRYYGEAPIRLQLHSRDPKSKPSFGPFSTLATPLAVHLLGKGPIGVRIAAGAQAPCDSSSNAIMYAGTLEASKPLSIATSATCICYEQTAAPFVTSGFGPARIHCRPQTCVGLACKPDLTQPFALALPSKP